MAQFFEIHPTHPQERLIQRAVDIISANGVIVYPTDTSYALGCKLGASQAIERIKQIRRIKDKHYFSILCQNLADISVYASVDNINYRLLKTYLPGPYTFVLKATREVPRKLMHTKRKTLGIRVPDNIILQALLAQWGGPLITTTLMLPGDAMPLVDPEEMRDRLGKQVDLVIDGGPGSFDETTVIDLSGDELEVLRQGVGTLEG